MLRVIGVAKDYAWGSLTAIPELLGLDVDGRPLAELWFGAHASAPAAIRPRLADYAANVPVNLRAYIAEDPIGTLGDDVVSRFGADLPYLLKVIAPARPLSLQVHPTLRRARRRFALENATGRKLDDPRRNYRDPNHKPELVLALAPFEALCGFRAPRRAARILKDLDAPLAQELFRILHNNPRPAGMRRAFTYLLDASTRPTPEEIQRVVEACSSRLSDVSPSPHADRIVTTLAGSYPDDPGVVASLLLNSVILQPGEALFVPAGGVHAYLSGLGVEIMASSDNVLRAGLTSKHIDVPEMLRCVDYVAAPPIRPAPERFVGATDAGSTRVYYAPVDDFELSVTDLDDHPADPPHPLPGSGGPRILVCLSGIVDVATRSDTVSLNRGEAIFVRADEGDLSVHGHGSLIQADVP